MKDLKVSINDKQIILKGDFVGELFCVDSSSIDEHPTLTSQEKDSLKKEFKMNKNILIK